MEGAASDCVAARNLLLRPGKGLVHELPRFTGRIIAPVRVVLLSGLLYGSWHMRLLSLFAQDKARTVLGTRCALLHVTLTFSYSPLEY